MTLYCIETENLMLTVFWFKFLFIKCIGQWCKKKEQENN